MSDPVEATPPPTQRPRPEVQGAPTPRELLVWSLLVLVIVSLVGLTIWRRMVPGAPPPPRLGTVPAFAFTDRDGTSVTSVDLAGAPYISDFFFTRCVSICPRLTQQMQRIDGALETDLGRRHPVRLVSFTVDPENDTPAVLDAYARRFDPSPRWHFLTGERDAMYTLIGQGFKLAVDDALDSAGMMPGDDILHSDRLVLVDGAGQIRGYYGAFDEADVDRLLTDVGTLVAARR